MAHQCHAIGCSTPTKPELFMCAKHWRMVPDVLKVAIYSTYRKGQCADKRPSRDWITATLAARKFVKEREALTPNLGCGGVR